MKRALLINLIFILITVVCIILSFYFGVFFFLPIFCFLPFTCGSKGLYRDETSYNNRSTAPREEHHPAENKQGIRFCPNCGRAIIVPDAKFCYHCATELKEENH
ncbi:MAG: zinc-ribbon domain-containing protein [Promethearchaeota archaeon]|nr:MAG: zinc-ribbon domain-containing protein [Candidatus Lokiarchaeota archaeon]